MPTDFNQCIEKHTPKNFDRWSSVWVYLGAFLDQQSNGTIRGQFGIRNPVAIPKNVVENATEGVNVRRRLRLMECVSLLGSAVFLSVNYGALRQRHSMAWRRQHGSE